MIAVVVLAVLNLGTVLAFVWLLQHQLSGFSVERQRLVNLVVARHVGEARALDPELIADKATKEQAPRDHMTIEGLS